MAEKDAKRKSKTDDEESLEHEKGEEASKEHEETVAEEKVESEKESADHETSEKEDKTPDRGSWHKRCWHWMLTHKKFSIPIAVVLVLAILAVLPFSRYALTGLVVKQSFAVNVVDAETGKPVSSATVTLNGQTTKTDGQGRAELRTKVGSTQLKIEKKYYESASIDVLVPIGKQQSPSEVKLKAIGRAVPVTVVNTISKKSVANATITAEGTEAKTDDEGKTLLVVPADKQEVDVTITGDGFNAASGKLTVTTEELPANTFQITPSGKIYFLSNASGKIDLVKSNLDGTDRQTVLAGTGKEGSELELRSSPDWKYLALRSKRDGGQYSKLFLIETENGKLTTMDEGEASFELYSWSGDRFIYKVNRDKKKGWDQKQYALKSYEASSKKITTLDETAAEGDQNTYAYEYFGNISFLNEEIVYTKSWSGWGYSWNYPSLSDLMQGKEDKLISIKSDGTQRKIVKGYSSGTNPHTSQIKLGELYIVYEDGQKYKIDKYQNGKIEAASISYEEFENTSYPSYIKSPSGKRVIRVEERDGKRNFFIADENGENGIQIGRTNDFYVDSWLTDDYIIFSKKGSEMYIISAADPSDIEQAFKVGDFYQPHYGHGY